MQHFIEGIDPTANTDPVTKADLLQLIRAAKTVELEGLIIWSQDAPDVIATPELASYLWGKLNISNAKTGEIYYYELGSWQYLPLVDGRLLAPGSVGLDKLSGSGAAAYYIIQRNAANNGQSWTSIPTAVQANSLDPNKLIAPDITNSYILTCIAGVKAFTVAPSIIAGIADGSIAVGKIAPGAANTFLRTNSGGTAAVFTTADIADILAAGYSAGQGIKRNVANDGWEAFTPGTAFAISPLTNGGAFWAIPGTGAVQAIAHGLGVLPKFMRVVFIKTSAAVDGWVVGDEVAVEGVVIDTGSNFQKPLVACGCDSTNITVSVATHTGTIWFNSKTGGSVAFDPTAWKIKAYVA